MFCSRLPCHRRSCYTRQILHQLFARLDVVLGRDGNLLHDGRSAAMIVSIVHDTGHGADGVVAQSHPELNLVFHGNLGIPLEVLFQDRFQVGMGEVAFVGEGGRYAAGDPAEKFLLMEDRFARQAAADIAVNGIGDVAARAVGATAHTRE